MFHRTLLLAAAVGVALGFKCPDTDDLFPFNIPHPTDPQKYYKCQDKVSILLSCPLDHVYDEALENCVEESDDPIHIVCPMENVIKYFPHPYDCSKYFQCSNGVGIRMECPKTIDGSLWFDTTLNVCNWPDLVECNAKPWPTTTEEPEVTTENSGEATTEDSGEATTEDGSAATDDDLDVIVKDNDDPIHIVCPMENVIRYFPHPYDCSKYFQCSNGVGIRMECPKTHDGSLWFDTTLNVCNWPDLVECNAKPWPTTTEEPEVTTEDSGEATTEDSVEGTTEDNTI